MKSIFKKSVFMAIFAFSMILNCSQAYGMFIPLYDAIDVKSFEKGCTLAHKKIQDFAKKCYETMTKNFGEEFDKKHPNLREKIDNFTIKNNILQICFSPKCAKIGFNGVYYPLRGIFIIEETIFDENGNELKDLELEAKSEIYLSISHIRAAICHEVSHAWLGHSVKFRPEINASQVEFEAENLTARVLNALGDYEAIIERLNQLYLAINQPFCSMYILGFLNGIASIKDDGLQEKISKFYGEFSEVGLTEEKDKFTDLEKETFKDTRKLYNNWKPVKTYNEAIDLSNKILGKKIKNESMFTITTLFNVEKICNVFTSGQLKTIDEVVSTIITLGAYQIFKKKNK